MTTLRDVFSSNTFAYVKDKSIYLHCFARSLSPYSKRSSSNRCACSRSRLQSLSKPPFNSTAIPGKMASADNNIIKILETIETMEKLGLDEASIDKVKANLSQAGKTTSWKPGQVQISITICISVFTHG